MMKSFWLCVQFFSRLPTPQYKTISPQEMGQSLAWFPAIGAIIGLGLILIAQLSQWLAPTVIALLTLAYWVWITGALHLDGLADTADGWLGGVGNHQRALEIMKDSRIGTGGGAALGLALLFKWVLLTELITAYTNDNTHQPLLLLLLMTPIVARIATLIYIKTSPYVSTEHTDKNMFSFLNPYWVTAWAISALALLTLSPWFLLLIPVWFWIKWISKNITGGMTGDTAGAMTETMEITLLFIGVLISS